MRRKREGSRPASRLEMVCCFRCFLAARHQRHVVVLGLRIIEFRDRNNENAGAVADGNAV